MVEDKWLYEIKSKDNSLSLNLKEIWRYRDLLLLFVKRDIVTVYKQTILGPLWFLIEPLFTSVIFTLVFNGIGDINTGGINPFLFNLGGITIWNYFKDCLNGTSNTFVKNAQLFGKVYFPRVVMPMSITISSLLKLGIQLLIFVAFYIYFALDGQGGEVSLHILLVPVYIAIMGVLGLGLGMIISSMTTKYRDLTILVTFGIQLLMYVSAVPYSLEGAQEKINEAIEETGSGGMMEVALPFIKANPLSQIIEGFRFSTMGEGIFSWGMLLYVVVTSIILFLVGLVIFNRTEKSFIDTV